MTLLGRLRDPLFILVGLVAGPHAAFSTTCLHAGWPGEFKKNACHPLSFIPDNTCQKTEFPCNPALFGENFCVLKDGKNLNLSCLSRFDSQEVAAKKVISFWRENPAALVEFDELFSASYEICDENFGDERNFIYCEELKTHLFNLSADLDVSEGRPPVPDPISTLINNVEVILERALGLPDESINHILSGETALENPGKSDPNDEFMDRPGGPPPSKQRGEQPADIRQDWFRFEDRGESKTSAKNNSREHQKTSLEMAICHLRSKQTLPLSKAIVEQSINMLKEALNAEENEVPIQEKRVIFCVLQNYYIQNGPIIDLMTLISDSLPGEENLCSNEL